MAEKGVIKVPWRTVTEEFEFDVPKRSLLVDAFELGNPRAFPLTFPDLNFHSLSPADAASLQLNWDITVGADSIGVRVLSRSPAVQGMIAKFYLEFRYPDPPETMFVSGLRGHRPFRFPVAKNSAKGHRSCSLSFNLPVVGTAEGNPPVWTDETRSIRVTITLDLFSAVEVGQPEEARSSAGRGMPLPVSTSVIAAESYFLSNFLSDFSISSGDEVWPAHKMVLAAGSEVFKRMFQSEMKEVKEGRLNIPDVDPEAVKKMMTYLYKGCCEFEGLNSETLFDLLELADMYDIKGLRGQTLSKIVSIITVENAPEMYTLAQVYSQNCVMDNALSVAKSNRAGFSKNLDHLKKLLETFPDFTFKVLQDA